METLNPAAAKFEEIVIEADLEVGVQHLITPDFSGDTFNEHVEELMIFKQKIKAQKYPEKRAAEGNDSWVAIIAGAFYE